METIEEFVGVTEREKRIWNHAIIRCIDALTEYANNDGYDGTIKKEGVRRLHDLKVNYGND